MLKYFKSPRFQEIKYNVIQTVLDHQNILDVGMSVAKSISGFAQTRSSLSFIEGGVGALKQTISAFSGDSNGFFSEVNGWERLASKYSDQALYDIVDSSLDNYPFKKLKFSSSTEESSIYTTLSGVVGKTKAALYYRPKENSKNDLLAFVIKDKIKFDNSKLFTITEKTIQSDMYTTIIKYDLISEESIAMKSNTASEMSEYIKRYMNQGITRSIIFNGLPGTGKSTLASSILQDLNLNTLKFKYNKTTNASFINVICFLVETFNIQAVLLDDFDYFNETASLLEFLEWLHRHTKVVIAITNSLKAFPPAVLRPGRFDEVIPIDNLDDEVIKMVLGDLYKKYNEKVCKWPIAYINELAIRINTNPNIDPDKYIKELQGRILYQTKALSSN